MFVELVKSNFIKLYKLYKAFLHLFSFTYIVFIFFGHFILRSNSHHWQNINYDFCLNKLLMLAAY